MSMEIKAKHYPNHLGSAGWFWAGNYQAERYFYILHRATGLGLILFVFFHLIETTFFRIQGESIWEMTMRLLHKPWFEAGLVLVTLAFVFHALNGLRLILLEFGFSLGRPKRPVYPFKDALRQKRGITVIAVAIIVVLVAVFFISRLLSGGG
jgi:succinate dehydrogenase / fumarate reductase cytochrome b subunit